MKVCLIAPPSPCVKEAVQDCESLLADTSKHLPAELQERTGRMLADLIREFHVHEECNRGRLEFYSRAPALALEDFLAQFGGSAEDVSKLLESALASRLREVQS